ncbi:MAG: DUF1109 domain-containing protein [Pseudomonadaceae bacterium]|nr:DUF1109 domain-containing protein [Pseudomonadaceae bacterium]
MASNRQDNAGAEREELINRLSSQSAFTHADPQRRGWLWLVISIAWVIGIGLFLDPVRSTSFAQLVSVPRFSLEMFLGAVAALAGTRAAFALAVPGVATPRIIGLAWLSASLWLIAIALTFITPALEPSMFGKRESCEWEAYLLSVPPILLGVMLQKRGAVLNPIAASALTGLTAGLLPALFMQMACMVDPWHSLSHHVAPMLAVTAAATLLSWAYQAIESRRAPRS